MATIGFTGTRNGLTDQQMAALQVVLIQECGADDEVHHGDCVGADAACHAVARSHGWRVVIHPPDNDAMRAQCEGDQTLSPLPFLERNRAIVDATDLLIACPEGPERVRSGTWSTVRYARRSGKPIVIVWPDGVVTREAP